MDELICVGQDGIQRIFYVEKIVPDSTNTDEIQFIVHKSNPPNTAQDDFFEFALVKVCESRFMVISIEHHFKEWYQKKGIPDAIIQYSSRILKGQIISSSNKSRSESGRGEFRTPYADKVWRRLVQKKIAIYDPEQDRFETKMAAL